MKPEIRLEAYKQLALRHGLVFVILNVSSLFAIAASVSLLRHMGIGMADWGAAVATGSQFFAQFVTPFGVILLTAVNVGQEFEQKTIVQQRLRSVLPTPYVLSKSMWLFTAVAGGQLLAYWVPGLFLQPVNAWTALTWNLFGLLLHDACLISITFLCVSVTHQALTGLLASAGFLVAIDWLGAALLTWLGEAFTRPTLSLMGAVSPWGLARYVAADGVSHTVPAALLLAAYSAILIAITVTVMRRKEYAGI